MIHRTAPALVRLAAQAAAALLVALPGLALGSSTPAPQFSLPARGGKTVSLAELKGQVVMINFWATWCGPCRQEMPILDSIYRKYSRLGFTLLGVNVEPDPKAAEQWLKETPVSFPVLFDTESKVSELYRVAGMPSTVILDRQGNIRFVHRGYRPGDENEYLNAIRALVRE